MRWYWLIFGHIPPELMLSRSDRRAIRRRARELKPPFLSKQRLLPTVAALAWNAIFLLLLIRSAHPTLTATFLLVGLVGLHTIAAWAWHKWIAQATRTALREAGHEVCVTCSYLLHSLPVDSVNCPECKTPRTPMPPPETPWASKTTKPYQPQPLPPGGLDQWS